MTEIANVDAKVVESHYSGPLADEASLPALIQGQVGKLNELDACVKSALEAAAKAEAQAAQARNLSAGRGIFTDHKKAAIEGLQTAGVELAKAVQSSASAQKTAFEFQQRLAEVTKYLFSLGVSNIAANRFVVRELEARLTGASKEALSELARQELLAVVKQLKEQEDLLHKQERMADLLRSHDEKLDKLLSQTDELDARILEGGSLLSSAVKVIRAVEVELKDSQNDISDIREKFSAEYSIAAESIARNEAKVGQLLARVGELSALLTEQDARQLAAAMRVDGIGAAVERQREDASNMLQNASNLQARLDALGKSLELLGAKVEENNARERSALNQRTILVSILVLALSVAAYFLR